MVVEEMETIKQGFIVSWKISICDLWKLCKSQNWNPVIRKYNLSIANHYYSQTKAKSILLENFSQI